jgi:hypothetical protein
MKRLALLLCAGLLAACADDAKEVGDPSGKISAPPAAQDTMPLWANVPETESQAAIAKVRDWVSEHLLDD